MKTILISAIGGDIAQGVATIIREADRDYRLIGTDTHREHGGTLFVDSFHVVPKAGDPGYKNRIFEIIENDSVDIVLPISEPELKVWAGANPVDRPVQWLMLKKGIVNSCLDKLETMRSLERLGLPVPWTVDVSESRPESLPCILKDRFGSGSKNIRLVNDDSDVDYFQAKYPDAVFQELLLPDDNEITCAVYRSLDKRTAVLQMRRKLTGGLSGWIETIDNSEVKVMCEKIAQGMGLSGSINIQLRITANGPRVFEINPRFSSTALMRHKLGFCDLLWSLDELQQKQVNFPDDIGHRTVVRTHYAEIID